MTQSTCIKLGFSMEKILSEIILSENKDIVNIKSSNVKGDHERDHLFINEETKEVVYAELKSNLNLDTEKTLATIKKCEDIVCDLKLEYPGYSLKWGIVGLRYIDNDSICEKILKKFKKIDKNIISVNEYLGLLGIKKKFDIKTYVSFINDIAKKLT